MALCELENSADSFLLLPRRYSDFSNTRNSSKSSPRTKNCLVSPPLQPRNSGSKKDTSSSPPDCFCWPRSESERRSPLENSGLTTSSVSFSTFLKGGASVESEWCLATQAFNDAMVLDSSSARAAPLRSVVTSLCDIARRTNKHQSFVQTNVLSTIERCFEELGEPKSASAIYESVGKFDDAVRILRSSDASDLEGAVDLCLRHKLKLSEETYETVISVSDDRHVYSALRRENDC